jgi:hypothetical protein
MLPVKKARAIRDVKIQFVTYCPRASLAKQILRIVSELYISGLSSAEDDMSEEICMKDVVLVEIHCSP